MAQKIYLDSSAILKRYVREKGSDSANLIYSKCDARELSIYFSFWNIGEVLGVLDQYRQRHWITHEQHDEAVKIFSGECLRLSMIDALTTIPLNSSVLADAWEIIQKYHVYEADAIQIVSFRGSEADYFLSADRSLMDVARMEKIPTIDIENPKEVDSNVGVS